MRRPSLLLLLACLCAVTSAAGDGARDPHAGIVRLRIEPGDGDYLAWAENLLAGPIEVRLDVASGEPPRPYASGSWGPSASVALIERDGRTWHEDSE